MPLSKNSVCVHVMVKCIIQATQTRSQALPGTATWDSGTGAIVSSLVSGGCDRIPSGDRFRPRMTMADPHMPGLPTSAAAHGNLPPPRLVEMALQGKEATLTDRGALLTYTQPHTGRAARDKYVVADPAADRQVWWGDVNQRLNPDRFEQIKERVEQHLAKQQLWVFEGWACADPRHRLPVRVIAERAWHALFANIILRRPTPAERTGLQPAAT